jgi:hypothetical protein
MDIKNDLGSDQKLLGLGVLKIHLQIAPKVFLEKL